MLSSTSTYTTKSDVTYSPSLDSFHISHSKCWGLDVHKVGSYCIFAYTDTFQDPRGKACVQRVHSEAVSFQHVSYSHRILSGTRLGTLVLQTDHSFYISHSEGLFNLTANVCCILPRVRSPLCNLHFYVKLANRK